MLLRVCVVVIAEHLHIRLVVMWEPTMVNLAFELVVELSGLHS